MAFFEKLKGKVKQRVEDYKDYKELAPYREEERRQQKLNKLDYRVAREQKRTELSKLRSQSQLSRLSVSEKRNKVMRQGQGFMGGPPSLLGGQSRPLSFNSPGAKPKNRKAKKRKNRSRPKRSGYY